MFLKRDRKTVGIVKIFVNVFEKNNEDGSFNPRLTGGGGDRLEYVGI